MEYKNLINEKVKSKEGKIGTITDAYEKGKTIYLIVQIEGEEKRYNFDALIKGFLTFENESLQYELKHEIEKKKTDEENFFKEINEHNNQRLEKLSKDKEVKKRKNSNYNKLNIAYKATYCDGNGYWFKNPCSKQCMENNIKSGRSWCSRSLCKKFIDGKVGQSVIDEHWQKDLCYESRILEDFTVSAGIDESGSPRSFVKLTRDRLVVLTKVEPSMQGNERIIFGTFLVENIIDQNGTDAAKALSYPKYRIELTQEEARHLKFWNYYSNVNCPESERWNQGLVRYLSDELSAKILYDIVQIIKKRNDIIQSSEAQLFLDKYLEIIGRAENDIKNLKKEKYDN